MFVLDDAGTLQTDCAPGGPSYTVVSTSSLPAERKLQSRHINPTQTPTRIQDTDNCNLTVIPGSQSSLDESRRKQHQLAVQKYKEEVYNLPKEPPADVLISFTNPPSTEGLQFSSGQRSGALSKHTQIRGQRDSADSDVAVWVSMIITILFILLIFVSLSVVCRNLLIQAKSQTIQDHLCIVPKYMTENVTCTNSTCITLPLNHIAFLCCLEPAR